MQELFVFKRKNLSPRSALRMSLRRRTTVGSRGLSLRAFDEPPRPILSAVQPSKRSRHSCACPFLSEIGCHGGEELLWVRVAFRFAPLTSLLGPYCPLFSRQNAPDILARVHFYLLCLFLPLVVVQRLVFLHGFELLLSILANGFDPRLLIVRQLECIVRFRSVRIGLVALRALRRRRAGGSTRIRTRTCLSRCW